MCIINWYTVLRIVVLCSDAELPPRCKAGFTCGFAWRDLKRETERERGSNIERDEEERKKRRDIQFKTVLDLSTCCELRIHFRLYTREHFMPATRIAFS